MADLVLAPPRGWHPKTYTFTFRSRSTRPVIDGFSILFFLNIRYSIGGMDAEITQQVAEAFVAFAVIGGLSMMIMLFGVVLSQIVSNLMDE